MTATAPFRDARETSHDDLFALDEGRLIGGGPKLRLVEWLALIHLQQTFEGDRQTMKAALALASERLEPKAAKTGRPRPGTRLRSPAGLARRLTVVRALAAGRLDGVPTEAIAAWHMFSTDSKAATVAAVELLGPDVIQTGFDRQGASIPSRGPEPYVGTLISEREDGATAVYVMELVGRAAALLDGAAEALVFVKVGRSGDTERRRDELNWGFPPGCGLEWHLAANRQFQSVEEAHSFEQSVLARLHGRGLCIGGEFARMQSDFAHRLLD